MTLNISKKTNTAFEIIGDQRVLWTIERRDDLKWAVYNPENGEQIVEEIFSTPTSAFEYLKMRDD